MGKLRSKRFPIDLSKYPVDKGCRGGPAEDHQHTNQEQHDNQGHYPPSSVAIQEVAELSEVAGVCHRSSLLASVIKGRTPSATRPATNSCPRSVKCSSS